MDLNKDRLLMAYNEAVTKIDQKRNGLLSGMLYKKDPWWVGCGALRDFSRPSAQGLLEYRAGLRRSLAVVSEELS